MYYLFIHKKADIDRYRKEFDRVSAEIKAGKTPVFSEMRCAKTNLIESVPYNLLNGLFLIGGTLFLQLFGISELLSIAIVLVVNNLCGAISNYIFTCIKHHFRVRLCYRLGVPADEHSIAVMESLEYQSV